ncbi:MAG: hypothetical protein D6698_01735 [Gammaproteobacteria bacterium]|nr:MAG: hypothetical protein D6698_01735 [Gammaproteobacteria bacterium]
MRVGLEMALEYDRRALKQMMAHAKRALALLPEDDDTRNKWVSFRSGCEDLLALISLAEKVAEYREGIVSVMEREGVEDWTIAAQSYAMGIGKDERVVMAMVREEFER